MSLDRSKGSLPGNLDKTRTTDSTGLDYPTNLSEAQSKLSNLKKLITDGSVEESVINEYFPGFNAEQYQNLISHSTSWKSFADQQYKTGDEWSFEIRPPQGQFYNPSEIKVVIPVQLQSKEGGKLDANTVGVNGWQIRMFENAEVKILNTDESITPVSKRSLINNFKELIATVPKDTIAKRCDVHWIEGAAVSDQRRAVGVADANLNARIAAFHDKQGARSYYLIPAKFFSPFFSINYLTNQAIKVIFTLEKNVRKLFETKKAGVTATVDDGKINVHATPWLSYRLSQMTTTALTYYDRILSSRKSFRFRTVSNFEPKTFEMIAGSISRTVTFTQTQRQFDGLLIYLADRNSNHHTSMLDSYDAELATKTISSVELLNVVNMNRTVSSVKYDLTDVTDRNNMHRMYLAYINNTSSLLDSSDYAFNPKALEYPSRVEYFEKGHFVYLDMSASLGYLDKEDPITHSSRDLTAEITLKSAVPAGRTYVLQVYGVSRAEYAQVLTLNGKTTVYTEFAQTNKNQS